MAYVLPRPSAVPRRMRGGPPVVAALALALVACGGGAPARTTGAAPSTSPASSTSSASSASSSASSTTSASTTPAADRVPPLFVPATASFVSAQVGFALGVAACLPGGTAQCAGMARTVDGGVHWTALTPPPLFDLTDPLHQPVLRFADPRTGFATDGRPGTGLYATHDGGATWSALTGIPPTAAVADVVVDAGHLLVVAGDDTSSALFLGTTDGTALVPVGPPLVGSDGAVDVAVSGERAYAVSSPGLEGSAVSAWSSTGLVTWTPMTVPCAAGGTGRVAAAGDRVVLGCQAQPTGAQATKRLWVSTDDGRAFAAAGGLNPDGYLEAVALGSAADVAVATSSDIDQLQASVDGGSTFSVAYASAVDGDGQGLQDLAYVDATHAFAVLGGAGPYALSLASGVRNVPGPRLLASVDGGLHWTQIQVRP